MSIVNRDLNSTEQKRAYDHMTRTAVALSGFVPIFQAPHALELEATCQIGAIGSSGAPAGAMHIRRFVVGAGETIFTIGPALVLTNRTTSGPNTYTFSLVPVQMEAGDFLVYGGSVANTSISELQVSVVAKALQDIKSWDY